MLFLKHLMIPTCYILLKSKYAIQFYFHSEMLTVLDVKWKFKL